MEKREYIGLTANPLKDRVSSHKSSFRSTTDSGSTTLSTFVKQQEELDREVKVNWEIVDEIKGKVNPGLGSCNLCNLEKYWILIEKPQQGFIRLNKRSELLYACPHLKTLDKILAAFKKRPPDQEGKGGDESKSAEANFQSTSKCTRKERSSKKAE